jgi:vanillate O-demethylase ferredoxin subunit
MSIQANVLSKKQLSNRIYQFELKPEKSVTEHVEAGSHIDIFLQSGEPRQYSIFESSDDTIKVAVQLENEGRGGSLEICTKINAGDVIHISEPRNHFKLDLNFDHYVLLGGGIGITPILAMAEELNKNDKSFELHYCVRDAESAAFAPFIQNKQFRNTFIHFDDGEPDQRLHLEEYFKVQPKYSQIYMCGPGGFMTAVEAATAHWSKGSVVKEHFAAPVSANQEQVGPFTVRIKSTDQVIAVDTDESITDALRKHGVTTRTSCSEGVCGSCIIDLAGGNPIHNDACLTDDERDSGELIVPCVSRAKPGEELVLDL